MEKYRFYFQDMDATGHPLHKLRYDVDGWKTYGVTFGRETNISNVVKSYTNSWTFIKQDADYLKQRMLLHGPNRRIRLIVQRLSDAMAGIYEEEYTGHIDLTQSKWDFNTFTAPVNEGGFFTQLENKWDTDFSMKHNSVLDFTGNIIEIKAETESAVGLTKYAEYNTKYAMFSIAGNLVSEENQGASMLFSGNEMRFLYCNIVSGGSENNPNDNRIFGSLSKSDALFTINNGGVLGNLSISSEISFNLEGQNYIGFPNGVFNTTYYGDSHLYLMVVDENDFDQNDVIENPQPGVNCNMLEFGSDNFSNYIDDTDTQGVFADKKILVNCNVNGHVSHNSGDLNRKYFYLIVRVRFGKATSQYGVQNIYVGPYSSGNLSQDKTILTVSDAVQKVKYNLMSQINNSVEVSVVPVVDMFKLLMEKVNDGRYNIGVGTQMLEQFADGDVLASGGGLRAVMSNQILGNGVYPSRLDITTSLAKFIQFVYVCYGLKFCVDYDRYSDAYKCYFNTISGIFSANQITRLERIADISFEVDRSKLYSKITAGYAVDDDVLMGRSEFNCKNTYSTPNTEIEENELSLESPYSAASFSIDTYILLNYGNLDDSSNEDGKIYVMSCKKVSEQNVGQAGLWLWGTDVVKRYELARDIQVDSGIAYPGTAFNVKFSPKRLLLRHQKEIDSYMAFNAGGAIKLEVCEYNKELDSVGIVEADDLVIGSHPLFYPVNITLNAAARERLIALIEANRCGYFTFDVNGYDVRGFIADDSGAVTVNPMNEQASEFKLLAKSLDGII